MVLDRRGDYILFKKESYYFCITEFNTYNRNNLSLQAFLHDTIAIGSISEYILQNEYTSFKIVKCNFRLV